MKTAGNADAPDQPQLKRVIGLTLLVLYGLGVTIGAGIYVLVGVAADKGGMYAPAGFLLAAFVMVFSAAAFAEFVSRLPKCAGEAVYVEAGFGRRWLMLVTGGLVILSSLIAAAAISVGCAGYIADLVPAPFPLLILGVVLLMGLVAAWGVEESLTVAGILTLIEICGLLVIIAAGLLADPNMAGRVGTAFPPLTDLSALQGVLAASLIAFFAFLGFNDMVNVAEETIRPERTLPLGIVISLGLVTLIYFLVAFVAVQSVPPAELAQSRAPIGLLFERLTGLSPLVITLIAIVATANGIVIQLIMAARVLYGLSENRQDLLGWLGTVNALTRTPLNATICVTAVVAVLAVFVALDELAEWASQMVLIVFVLVNVALVLVKRRETERPVGVFTVPAFVPVIGAATCLFLLAAPLFTA